MILFVFGGENRFANAQLLLAVLEAFKQVLNLPIGFGTSNFAIGFQGTNKPNLSSKLLEIGVKDQVCWGKLTVIAAARTKKLILAGGLILRHTVGQSS
jgi:hypothetical protein